MSADTPPDSQAPRTPADLPALIAEVLRLDGEATPGPWDMWEEDGPKGTRWVLAPDGDVVADTYSNLGMTPAADADQNARLIAEYRTAAPTLARALAAEREARQRAEQERDFALDCQPADDFCGECCACLRRHVRVREAETAQKEAERQDAEERAAQAEEARRVAEERVREWEDRCARARSDLATMSRRSTENAAAANEARQRLARIVSPGFQSYLEGVLLDCGVTMEQSERGAAAVTESIRASLTTDGSGSRTTTDGGGT